MRKIAILVLGMSLFFSAPFASKAEEIKFSADKNVNLKDFDPMVRVLEEVYRIKEEKKEVEVEDFKPKIGDAREKSSKGLKNKESDSVDLGRKDKNQLENFAKKEESKENESNNISAGFSRQSKPVINEVIIKLSPETIDPLSKIEEMILGDKKVEVEGTGKSEIKVEISNSDEASEKKEIEKKYLSLLLDSPMQEMIPAISKESREVASFLIAIAKKESNFGQYAPVKDGRDCFNYWGYKGSYNQTQSGYSCFDSPEQAVEVVGGRIERLLEQKIDTPEKMVVWKCGSDCNATGGQAAANKWISDVDLYYQKIINDQEA
jgi:hypothetical protein